MKHLWPSTDLPALDPQLVNTLLYYLPMPRDVRLLVAGLLAGLSMYFFRSTSLSLYVAGKAIEVSRLKYCHFTSSCKHHELLLQLLYFKAVERGWLKSWYYGDVLVYALSTATIFHAVSCHVPGSCLVH